MSRLTGYGPHEITTDGDYDIACIVVDGNRPTLDTISLDWGTFDGDVTFKTRKRGSDADFEVQSYVESDGSVAVAALSGPTDKTVQIDVTGKDLRITTNGRSMGTLLVEHDVATDP